MRPVTVLMQLADRLQGAWSDLPLRHKLTVLLGVGTGLAAGLTAAAMLLTSVSFSTTQVREQAREVTRTLAYMLQGPLAAADTAGITRSLDVLEIRPHVLKAWVTDARGDTVLATWGRDPRPVAPPPGGGLLDDALTTSAPILDRSGGVLGQITVQLDLQDQRRNVRTLCIVLIAVGLSALLLSYAMARAMARRLARPLLDLSATATAVAAGQDFDARLEGTGRDEVGQAVSAFNAMLDEIRHRDRSMAELNGQLTAMVDARTQEARRAEAASSAKSLFLANMSHEIRTPMNGIICMTDLVLETPLTPDQREYLGLVKSSSDALLLVVNDILDYARIEAGRLTLEAVAFSLQDLLRDSLVALVHRARDKGLSLHHQVATSADLLVADPVRLRQILLHLVDNAIKFTSDGRIDVLATCRSDELGQAWLDVSVSDTGIGIPIDKQQLIFDAFTQADASTTRRHGGTGLGLAICAELVRLMEGRIRVDSTVGRGSTFLVTVKVKLSSGHEAMPAPPAEPLDDPAWPDLDHQALIERLGADPELARELTALLVEDCQHRLVDLQACIARGDGPGTAQLAHQLVGAAGNCSAVALSKLAGQLVRAARADQMALSARLLECLQQRLGRLSRIVVPT